MLHVTLAALIGMHGHLTDMAAREMNAGAVALALRDGQRSLDAAVAHGDIVLLPEGIIAAVHGGIELLEIVRMMRLAEYIVDEIQYVGGLLGARLSVLEHDAFLPMIYNSTTSPSFSIRAFIPPAAFRRACTPS